jgi:hypothetical protein
MRDWIVILTAGLLLSACAAQVRSPSKPQPVYDLSDDDLAEIARIDEDIRNHRQITYLSVDRPGVVAHFMRHACRLTDGPDADWWYAVRMRRLLNRHPCAAPLRLDDPRMDWDVWNLYLQTEDADETDPPKWSPWQLLLRHFLRNANEIAGDPARVRWWLNELFDGTDNPRRAALVFFFISCLDSSTEEHHWELFDQAVAEGESNWPMSRFRSTPDWPNVELFGGRLPSDMRNFRGALDALAASLGYDWVAWGFDEGNLPLPRARKIGAPMFVQDYVLDQLSWSDSSEYRPKSMAACGYLREPDSWQPYIRVDAPREGKVVLFSHNRTLLCISRDKLADAAIRLATRVGLIDTADLQIFYDRGFVPLTEIPGSP